MLSPSQIPSGFLPAQYADVGQSDLNVVPIEPSWILEGQPVSRIKLLTQAQDELYAVALWDCTAGVFRWYFGCDEVVHILEGEVTVREDNGTERTLRVGDVGFFPKGSTNIWVVNKYVRKMAINRYSKTTPVDLVKKVVRRGRSELKKLYSVVRPSQAAS